MGSIGKNIADARKALGLTQEELAARVGYKTKSAINKIELGIRDLPQKKIATFAAALGTTPGRLMGWDEEIKKDPEAAAIEAAALLRDQEYMEIIELYKSLDPGKRSQVKDFLIFLNS